MNDYQKTPVIYQGFDPTQEGVTFIAIQTSTLPPYVFGIYGFKNKEDIGPLPNEDLLLVSAQQAKRLFDFQKGNLADVIFNFHDDAGK